MANKNLIFNKIELISAYYQVVVNKKRQKGVSLSILYYLYA